MPGVAHGNRSDVWFDFEGSLALARRLWRLAGTVEEHQGSRVAAGRVGRQQWIGTYATEFDGRVHDESTSATHVADALRESARRYALCWREATFEQAKRVYARHVDAVKHDRNLLEQAGDWLFGDDTNYGPAPSEPSVPSPPSFYPTA